MRAVIVDDEPIMIRSFVRYTSNIEDLEIVGKFDDSIDAYSFICNNPVDVIFVDIKMPGIDGLDMVRRIKARKPEMLVVFITAFDSFIKESNELDADYYIVKPYKEETITSVVERLRKLMGREEKRTSGNKDIVIHTFGRFAVLVDGKPVHLVGKTKEIMALIVSRRGREISNEELYSTIWEDREYDNIHMKVYYNAVKRLRDGLEKLDAGNLLISTSRGQMLNTSICQCDFLEWLGGSKDDKFKYEGEFLSEYKWAVPLKKELFS